LFEFGISKQLLNRWNYYVFDPAVQFRADVQMDPLSLISSRATLSAVGSLVSSLNVG